MSVRIVDDRRGGTIPVRELRDGQLGEITAWPGGISHLRGLIVQHRGKELVAVGKHDSESWPTIPVGDDNRARVLPNGTLLEVTDNE